MRNLVFFLLLACSLQAQKFEISDILSAPYCTNLTASTYSDHFAWVVNKGGVRNIYLAKAPDFRPDRVTNYTEDDGQVISSIHFLPDEKSLIYVRGGGPNRNGELPNPTSSAKGVTRQIWRVHFERKVPQKLFAGSNPVLSPNGHTLIVNGGRIFRFNKEANDFQDWKRLKVRRGSGSYQWSPDGRLLAFVSNRGDHSFVGIYSPETNRIKWVNPGVDKDSNPVWSPDSRQVAFIRSPGSKRGELPNITGANPFSILVADVNTGQAKTIWESPNETAGGFAQYYPAEPLRWAANNQILFYSEHEGWMHVYAINASREGTVIDLTPGDCEAEHSTLSPDGRNLIFSSNCEDINRRHLWKVSVFGGKPNRLTKDMEIETNPIVLGSGHWMVFRVAAYNRPTSIMTVREDGRQLRMIYPEKMPKPFPEKDLVKPEAVVFKAADGTAIHGQLFLPKDRNRRQPAVVFMHGGPIRQMLLGYHYSGYYANAYAMNQYLCNQGYVVLSVNFRAGIGYGQAFRRAENQGPRGASEYQDIVAAGKYLQSRQEVDKKKIGLWGGSYGGYLTAMGLARNSDLFAAGVDLHGVHDWAWRGKDFSPGGFWGITEELMDLAHQSSPVSDLSKWTSPVLLVHGDDDRNVMFGQTVDLARRLRAKGVQPEILVFPDEVHGFLRYESWLRTFQEAKSFFDRYLMEKP